MGAGFEVNLEDLRGEIEMVAGQMMPAEMPKTVQDVSVYLAAAVKRRFDTAAAPDGTPWAPLKQQRSRPRDKRARGGSGQKPLRDTGILMASASGQQGAEGAFREFGPLSLVQGSNLDYAAIHNFGGTIKFPERRRSGRFFWAWQDAGDRQWIFTKRIRAHDVTIPARPFIGLSDRDVDKIVLIAADNLANGTP